jgi:hypothetical protein
MKKNPNNDLLIVGAKDFLQASAAIAEFGDALYDAARAVLKRHTIELDAAGIPLNIKKVKPHPKDGYIGNGYDGTDASIGAYAPLPNGCWYYLYVWWRASDDDQSAEVCSAMASIGCYTVGAAELLFQALNDSKGTFNIDQYEVYVEEVLKPEDFVGLESRFEKLVQQWIVGGKAAGGLKKYLK